MLIGSSTKLVLGLGATGLSVVNYLKPQGFTLRVADTRADPPGLAHFKATWPDLPLHLGSIPTHWFDEVDEIIVSPGLAANLPELEAARSRGISVVGDISLFTRVCKAPIIAVTGSNGKSTLVDLLGQIAKRLGFKVAVLGNIGVPVLSRVHEDLELVILELSSFQLELIDQLNAKVALILNISPDHLDRYANMQAYWMAKQKIFNGAKAVVINRQDPLTVPVDGVNRDVAAFGLASPNGQDFGILMRQDSAVIAAGIEPLLKVDTIKLVGAHNWKNVMAALGVAQLMRWPMQDVIESIQHYPGLKHRCQWVGNFKGADWFNDSKGTNIGATMAAIESLTRQRQSAQVSVIQAHKQAQAKDQTARRLLWIAGGQAKAADFAPLATLVSVHVTQAFLFGEDQQALARALSGVGYEDYVCVADLREAVALAMKAAKSGDLVIFSPACASFDQFDGFEQRGDCFIQWVQELDES